MLYLLHGIGGDETEWERYAHPEVLLDNLILRAKHEEARRSPAQSGRHEEAETALAFLRQSGRLLPHQPGSAYILE